MIKIILNNLIVIGIPTVLALGMVYIFKKIVDSSWQDFWSWAKNIKFGKYCWTPKQELRNHGQFKDINTYPMDLKLNCNFDLELDKNTKDLGTLKGEESFLQGIKIFVHTERNYRHGTGEEYGNEQSHSIFYVNKRDEFEKQCHYMAEAILNHESFKNYIQQIYRICRNRNELTIDMKVYGKPETLVCRIPYLTSKTQHKKRQEEILQDNNKEISAYAQKTVKSQPKIKKMEDKSNFIKGELNG